MATATLEQLKAKPRRQDKVPLKIPQEDGTTVTVDVVIQAMGSKAFDDLIGDHPPTDEDKKDGAQWNGDTFPPALVAGCAIDPKMSYEDTLEIWQSEAWSQGELLTLFNACLNLNMRGLNVPKYGGASG